MSEELPIMAVLDTDTYNEVDDQFTLAYALLAPEAVDLRAVIAAPFSNFRAATPAEGMRKSYDEIRRIIDILGKSPENFAWHGSANYLPDKRTPVDSEGARRIIELAHEARAAGRKLHVLAIAAITDVASALLLEPGIARDIVVIWLGSHEADYPGENNEFNLRQDVPAAQIVFDADVPLVWVPCRDVASHLDITLAELRPGLAPAGRIGEFLYGRCEELMNLRKISSKIIDRGVFRGAAGVFLRNDHCSGHQRRPDAEHGAGAARHRAREVARPRDCLCRPVRETLPRRSGERLTQRYSLHAETCE